MRRVCFAHSVGYMLQLLLGGLLLLLLLLPVRVRRAVLRCGMRGPCALGVAAIDAPPVLEATPDWLA